MYWSFKQLKVMALIMVMILSIAVPVNAKGKTRYSKSIEEILNYLNSQFLCKEVDVKDLKYNPIMVNLMSITKKNIDEYYKQFGYDKALIDLYIGIVTITDMNSEINQKIFSENALQNMEVLVIIDRESGYIYSSSNTIYCLLEIYKGYSEIDIQLNSIRYRHCQGLEIKHPELVDYISDKDQKSHKT